MKNIIIISGVILITILIQSCTKEVDNAIRDIDGNVYKTIKIGNQIWMAENLKTTKYNDGTTSIPLVTDNKWYTLSAPGYCWYNNDESGNKNTFGAMYNWYVVDVNSNGGKNVCPSGWHIPTEKEFSALTTFLGGLSIAGGKLKSTGTIEGGDGLWNSPNEGATNESGFTAHPGGDRSGIDGSTYGIMGQSGEFWSSTQSIYNPNAGRQLSMYYHVIYAEINNAVKELGISVRCVKD